MFERFIGHNCEAIVLFGDVYTMSARAVPAHVHGVLESCDDKCICIKTKKGYSILPINTLLNLIITEK